MTEVALVVLAPTMDVVPERIPATTEAGNLTLKKLAKADRASFYKLLLCGHLLATLRETFAVCPNVAAARAVVLRSSGSDSYGRPRVECVLAGRFARQAFDGIQWETADAAQIVNDTATELLANQKGQAKEFQPLDLSKEPELAALLSEVDLAELTRGES